MLKQTISQIFGFICLVYVSIIQAETPMQSNTIMPSTWANETSTPLQPASVSNTQTVNGTVEAETVPSNPKETAPSQPKIYTPETTSRKKLFPVPLPQITPSHTTKNNATKYLILEVREWNEAERKQRPTRKKVRIIKPKMNKTQSH